MLRKLIQTNWSETDCRINEEGVFSFTCETTFVKQLKEPNGKMIWTLFTQALGKRCAAYFGCKRDTAKTTGWGFHRVFCF